MRGEIEASSGVRILLFDDFYMVSEPHTLCWIYSCCGCEKLFVAKIDLKLQCCSRSGSFIQIPLFRS
ncbi:hypothetical protein Ccrd_006679 [Cynara cardunculus var. scolymus]|uniref:Uncharacterized protein n=1 Tax=Cynara cardunculus var. scolymus TaxID=59895 RepID=A0A103XID2_CYNCS|nr:hypothetical protein Ccrd_006679 [Cynara cardunculus var. scolymus]